jgi:hypothetical protein
MRTDGRTTKLIVAFRNFANAPKTNNFMKEFDIRSRSREMMIYKPVLLEEFRVGNIVKTSGLNCEVLFFAVLEYRTNSRRCLSQASAITFTQRKYNFGKV